MSEEVMFRLKFVSSTMRSGSVKVDETDAGCDWGLNCHWSLTTLMSIYLRKLRLRSVSSTRRADNVAMNEAYSGHAWDPFFHWLLSKLLFICLNIWQHRLKCHLNILVQKALVYFMVTKDEIWSVVLVTSLSNGKLGLGGVTTALPLDFNWAGIPCQILAIYRNPIQTLS
ncbi:hypothetical protein J6590_092148 [Homalodisca vitripennis]|nr:hypothetical protein J6590_092148 [Homalodisca vitripennis]